MPIWTFDLPDDAQPNLILDLSSLSVVTAPGAGRSITVEADEPLEPLLDVTADGAMVTIRLAVGSGDISCACDGARPHPP